MNSIFEGLQTILRVVASFGWPVTLVTAILRDEKCALTLFNDNFLHAHCLSLAISKTLGYIAVLGAFVYKMPIVLNMIKSRNGNGLDPSSLYIECSVFMAQVYYSFRIGVDFSTYGDNLSATVQNFMIIVLLWVWGYDGKKMDWSHIAAILCAAIVFITVMVSLPEQYLGYIATYAIILSIVSKLPQIIKNFRTGQRGVQSFVTVLVQVLGALMKLFVVTVETNDIFIISSATMTLILNSILMFQIVFILKSDATAVEKKRD